MAGGGGAKSDEFKPHPVKEQLPGVDYCVTSHPDWPEAILLGFQHYIVMIGTTVIISGLVVPVMGGGKEEKAKVIQTIVFVAGVKTMLQTLFGTRLPVVIGGSYTFVIPTLSIALANRYSVYIDPHERFLHTMRGVQGALIISSLFQIIVGFSGLWRNVVRFLSPLSAVPLVTLSGLGLFKWGVPEMAKCIEIGLPQLILLIFLSQYLRDIYKSKPAVVERSAVLFSVAIVWLYAEFLTMSGAYNKRSPNTQTSCRTDRSGLISASPWMRVPYPFQWGRPTFKSGEVFGMMSASVVALVESTGTFIAVSRYGSATHPPASVLSRGAGWQGMGILLDGLFGTANGSTASVENAGFLGLTRVGSRRVVQISAVFMLFFSVSGKFGGLLASIPLPIFAAMYCVFFAYVSSAGLGYLQFCNLNSFRTKFILGFSFFMGISVPHYFNEYLIVSGHGPVQTHSTWFNDMMQVIFGSHAMVAFMVAIFLDCTLGLGDASTRLDRGFHWWEKFICFSTDTRSEEFYSLPYNLNKLFPSF